MSRSLMHRLAKLERQRLAIISRWHRIIDDTEAELASKAAELRASAEWQEGDGIIQRLIVDPPQRVAA